MNPPGLIRAWLLADASPLPALLGDRPTTGQSVWYPDLPEKFNPENGPDPDLYGPGITIAVRGGGGHPEIPVLQKLRFQLTVWCGVNKYVQARTIYGALYDYIHGSNNIIVPGHGTIKTCTEVVAGQDLTDPDTLWAIVLGYYEILFSA